jgi:hypothetical protein
MKKFAQAAVGFTVKRLEINSPAAEPQLQGAPAVSAQVNIYRLA